MLQEMVGGEEVYLAAKQFLQEQGATVSNQYDDPTKLKQDS
jgi:hypothetical protein